MNLKKVKTIAVLLIIVLISVIAFGGLYVKKQGIWKSVLPEFKYGMELDGFRELRFILDTTEEEKEVYVDENGNIMGEVQEDEEHNHDDEPESEGISLEENQEESQTEETVAEENTDEVNGYKKETRTIKKNSDEVVNIDNFEKSKKIIQKRLENLSAYEYNIRMDTITGELVVEVPDDEKIDVEESLITTIGKFQIIDHQTGIILIDNKNVKSATALNAQTDEGYQFYLQVQFDKAGAEKLTEISKEYITTVDEAGEESTKFISIEFDGQDMLTTSFGEEINSGMLQIQLGQVATDAETFNDTRDRVQRIAEVINGDMMPLAYVLNSDNYIKSTITENTIFIAEIVFAILVLIISIFMIIKYKLKGLVTSILGVGYIALLTLIVKYTNVTITLNAIIAFLSVIAINYIFMMKLLKELTKISNIKSAFGNVMKELYLTIIPVCIIAIIFTFMPGVIISSIGMVLFWGLLVQALYNTLVIFALGII